jgi:hypothetical protein
MILEQKCKNNQMILSQRNKLQHLFNLKFLEIEQKSKDLISDWEKYLIKNEIKIAHIEVVDNANQDEHLICIQDPCMFMYITVPLDFAEKALVLGFLP